MGHYPVFFPVIAGSPGEARERGMAFVESYMSERDGKLFDFDYYEAESDDGIIDLMTPEGITYLEELWDEYCYFKVEHIQKIQNWFGNLTAEKIAESMRDDKADWLYNANVLGSYDGHNVRLYDNNLNGIQDGSDFKGLIQVIESMKKELTGDDKVFLTKVQGHF